MSQYTSDQIRNILLAGHAGAGKTLLAESLLFAAGAIRAKGEISRGTTVCDFDPKEKELGHSLDTALCHFDHDNIHVNLIDTPGYPDFLGRAIAALPAAETVAVVVNAKAGVELSTQRIMDVAKSYNMCRMVIINHIDAADADLHGTLRSVREAFGDECLPLNLPGGGGSKVVDCFFEMSDEETDFASVATTHTEIVDQVVEVDEKLMELYLEQGEELGLEQLHDPFEKALRSGHLVPICFTSAETGVGVKQLLKIFEMLMPNPNEGNPPHFIRKEHGKSVPVDLAPDPDRHAIAHVFKVTVDPFVGRLGIFRIHQGTITPNSQLYIGDARKPFKVAHLLAMQGKEHVEVPRGIPGDICAIAKIDDIEFDSVLHDSHDEDDFRLKPAAAQPPMYGLAIEATRRGDEQKISEALHKIAAEDPTLKIEHIAVANETVLRGMGELHLRIVLERMKERYNVEVNTRPPSIAYRETIRANAEGHFRHKKQTGGAGQFGEVFLRIEPLARDEGFEFDNKVVGGAIPSQFIPAVEKGVRQVLADGAIAGYPLQDIRVTVYDGKFHAVDSKEVAFVAAGKKAFAKAVAKAKPVILEPIVNIEITAPSDAMGDIAGDLSSRRGRISGNTVKSDGQVQIAGQVPLAELTDYQSRLKSITGGEGFYTLNFSHYDPVPPQTQKSMQEAYEPGSDD